MKKHLCKNKESPDFKIKHPNETFESWDERKTEAYNSIIQNMKENGQAVVPEELLNYDWLNNQKERGKNMKNSITKKDIDNILKDTLIKVEQ